MKQDAESECLVNASLKRGGKKNEQNGLYAFVLLNLVCTIVGIIVVCLNLYVNNISSSLEKSQTLPTSQELPTWARDLIYNLSHSNVVKVVKEHERIIQMSHSPSLSPTRKPAFFTHVVPPYRASPESDNFWHQPLALASIIAAAKRAKLFGISVKLYAITIPEDIDYIPDAFQALSPFKGSIREAYPDIFGEKQDLEFLPLVFVKDIFQSVLDATSEQDEYIVYTNADIILSDMFYIKMYEQIQSKDQGQAFTVQRQNNVKGEDEDGNRYTVYELDKIISQHNSRKAHHGGGDTYVIRRDYTKQLILDDLIIGTAVWDNCVMRQLQMFPDARYRRIVGEFINFHIGRNEKGWQGCSEEKDPVHDRLTCWNVMATWSNLYRFQQNSVVTIADLGKVTNSTEQWQQFKPKLKEKANQLMYRYSYHCETCSEFTEICDHFTLVKEHSPIFCASDSQASSFQKMTEIISEFRGGGHF